MPVEMLERLRLDPGSRTVGELFQERQWAVQEIDRLRDLGKREASTRAKSVAAANAGRDVSESPHDESSRRTGNTSAIQLLRLADVRDLVGLSRSTIYMKIAQGRFPPGIRVSDRARRWRLADIVAWQEKLFG